jgi:hypothetical protein
MVILNIYHYDYLHTPHLLGILDWEAWYTGQRVHALPLLNPFDHVDPANLTDSMLDTDKTLQTFFDGCVAAGPDACAFYAPTASEIATNLADLTESIRAQPIPVLTDLSHGIVDFSFLRNYIFDSLSSPYNSFASFAQGLAALAAGNATGVYTANEVAAFECDCDAAAPFTQNIYESQIATACGDAASVDDSIAELREFYRNEAAVSSFADIRGYWRIYCSCVRRTLPLIYTDEVND